MPTWPSARLGRRPRLVVLRALLLALAVSSPVAAQGVVVVVPAEGTTQELRLRDGSTLYGRVIDASDPATFVSTSGLQVSVPHADITSLTIVDGVVQDGVLWRDDPNATRLFFGPTARTLEAGSGYFSVFEVVMPLVSFAVTDHITLAGGTPLFFGGDDFDRLFWVAPKVRVGASEGTDYALGVLAFGTTGGEGSAGLLYGVVTRGSPRSAITLGLGYGFVDGDLASNPAIMVGAETRISSGTKLLTENYLLPEGDVLFSVGPRFFGESLSADIGLLFPFIDGSIDLVLPVVNFAVNW